MPERIIEHITVLMYALAAISGGLGGCAVAAHDVLRGGRPRLSFIFAYAIVGSVFGVLALAYGSWFGVETKTTDHLIGNSVLVGAFGSAVLASTNISARWVLKRLGIEVEVNIKRKGGQ